MAFQNLNQQDGHFSGLGKFQLQYASFMLHES